jgi:putative flippase GtrA
MKINKPPKFKFARHILTGGIATIIDWTMFYALAIIIGIYYQIALIISIATASITNYILSKTFTFKCKSKKIIPQFFLFSIIVIIYLLLSILLMTLFVESLNLHKMTSKILTTGIMLIINYNLHKHITFNKKFFN